MPVMLAFPLPNLVTLRADLDRASYAFEKLSRPRKAAQFRRFHAKCAVQCVTLASWALSRFPPLADCMRIYRSNGV
jgi:hypothetical protein